MSPGLSGRFPRSTPETHCRPRCTRRQPSPYPRAQRCQVHHRKGSPMKRTFIASPRGRDAWPGRLRRLVEPHHAHDLRNGRRARPRSSSAARTSASRPCWPRSRRCAQRQGGHRDDPAQHRQPRGLPQGPGRQVDRHRARVHRFAADLPEEGLHRKGVRRGVPALKAALPANWVILNKSAAEDKNSLVVTKDTASKWSLKSIGDLVAHQDEITLGAPPEFQTRQQGLVGLKSESFRPQGVHRPKRQGIGRRPGQRPGPGRQHLQHYAVDRRQRVRHPRRPEAAVRLGQCRAAHAQGQGHRHDHNTLNAVSAKLTTPVLTDLLKQTDIDKKDAKVVAKEFVTRTVSARPIGPVRPWPPRVTGAVCRATSRGPRSRTPRCTRICGTRAPARRRPRASPTLRPRRPDRASGTREPRPRTTTSAPRPN